MAEEKFCPKIEPISSNVVNLSYGEKLQLVEKEAQSLYAFCMTKRFTSDEVHDCVSELRGPRPTKTKKILHDSSASIFTLSVVVALIATIFVSDVAYNMFVVHAKLVAIKVCFITFFFFLSLAVIDCKLCGK